MTTEKKKTPLFDWHTQNGANMVEFGDYVMPVWYASARDEHMAVVTHAGLFDTSHMAAVRVHGPGSFDLLQWCFTRNLNSCVGKDNAPITPGKCVYGAFLDERGEAIDDSIVYKVEDEEYLVVVNAGMGGVIAAHLEANKKGLRVRCIDMTDKLGKIDIQGPAAIKTMQKVLKAPDAVFDKLTYFSFKGHFDRSSELRRRRAVAGRDAPAALAIGLHGRGGVRNLRRAGAHRQGVGNADGRRQGVRPHGMRPGGARLAADRRGAAAFPPGHRPLDLHPPPLAVCPAVRSAAGGFTKTFLGSDVLEKATDAPTP